MSAKPFFHADQVGSLLRPQNLLEARLDWKAGKISRAELRIVEDAAIADVVKIQEDLGLDAVTDGGSILSKPSTGSKSAPRMTIPRSARTRTMAAITSRKTC